MEWRHEFGEMVWAHQDLNLGPIDYESPDVFSCF